MILENGTAGAYLRADEEGTRCHFSNGFTFLISGNADQIADSCKTGVGYVDEHNSWQPSMWATLNLLLFAAKHFSTTESTRIFDTAILAVSRAVKTHEISWKYRELRELDRE